MDIFQEKTRYKGSNSALKLSSSMNLKNSQILHMIL